MSKRRGPESVDRDNPEWTEDDFSRARPAEAVLGELFGEAQACEMLKPRRGRPAALETKEQVSLRLDPAILAAFRASGSGWQTRINKALADWLKEHDPKELKRA
ncbi:BrnA antitoxin of type II toxin-antitoxin system [compost metagenome]